MTVTKFGAVAIVAMFTFSGVGFAEVENREGHAAGSSCSKCAKKLESASQNNPSEISAKMIADQKDHYPLTTCVVGGGKLGEMGEPVSAVVDNRLVLLCCAGCEKKLRAEPAQFIAKLDEAVIAQQADSYPFEVCMVSGERFGGSRGKAIEKVIANRLVKFCCAGCETMFNANPAKYFHMLDTGVLEVSEHEGSSSKHE